MPNPRSTALTNQVTASKKQDPKRIITFEELWSNFPTGYPCDQQAFPDQCSIRVAVALQNSGASLVTFKGATCWYHKNQKHALRAEELANWLNKKYLAGWPDPTDITGANWQTTAENKKGIIFFKDYWLRSGETSPTGDHIDLWNGSRFPVTSFASGVTGFLRFGLGVGSVDTSLAQFSDLAKAQEILIWDIK